MSGLNSAGMLFSSSKLDQVLSGQSKAEAEGQQMAEQLRGIQTELLIQKKNNQQLAKDLALVRQDTSACKVEMQSLLDEFRTNTLDAFNQANSAATGVNGFVETILAAIARLEQASLKTPPTPSVNVTWHQAGIPDVSLKGTEDPPASSYKPLPAHSSISRPVRDSPGYDATVGSVQRASRLFTPFGPTPTALDKLLAKPPVFGSLGRSSFPALVERSESKAKDSSFEKASKKAVSATLANGKPSGNASKWRDSFPLKASDWVDDFDDENDELAVGGKDVVEHEVGPRGDVDEKEGVRSA